MCDCCNTPAVVTSLWSAHIHRQTQPCYQVLDGNELLSEKNETEVKKLRKVTTVAVKRVTIVAIAHLYSSMGKALQQYDILLEHSHFHCLAMRPDAVQ